jgi:hypothetical protein
MLYWAIQTSIISIILIFLVHHLIQFFRDALTIPKVKDLVNAPKQKYETMLSVINCEEVENIDSSFNDAYKQNLLPIGEKTNNVTLDVENMKDELKLYLKNQNVTKSNL